MRKWAWWGVAALEAVALAAAFAIAPPGSAPPPASGRPRISAHARVHRIEAVAPEPEPVRAVRPRRRTVALGTEMARQRALMASAVVFLLRGEHPVVLRR